MAAYPCGNGGCSVRKAALRTLHPGRGRAVRLVLPLRNWAAWHRPAHGHRVLAEPQAAMLMST